MNLTDPLGYAACAATLIFFSVGSITQIVKHYREKRVGLTSFYAAWPLVSHILWFAYGIARKDPFLIYVNVFAVVMVSIICLQKFYWYRETQNRP